MSAPIDNGGPAFPHHVVRESMGHSYDERGMTLRDWFAGQALAGICANAGWCDMLMAPGMAEANAKAAYAYADAMIAARKGEAS